MKKIRNTRKYRKGVKIGEDREKSMAKALEKLVGKSLDGFVILSYRESTRHEDRSFHSDYILVIESKTSSEILEIAIDVKSSVWRAKKQANQITWQEASGVKRYPRFIVPIVVPAHGANADEVGRVILNACQKRWTIMVRIWFRQ